MLTNKKALLFDMDGSLIDSMWIWREIDREFLGRYNIELPDDLQKNIEGMSVKETAVYFKNRFSIPEDLDTIVGIWNQMAWDKYKFEVSLKPGAMELLNYARANGIKLGIGTSNTTELVTVFLKENHLNDYFSCVVTGNDVNKGKPNPEVYLKAAKLLMVDPGDCLVFEDIEPGIMAAKNANMSVCAVYDDYSKERTLQKKSLADYFIKDFTDIILR